MLLEFRPPCSEADDVTSLTPLKLFQSDGLDRVCVRVWGVLIIIPSIAPLHCLRMLQPRQYHTVSFTSHGGTLVRQGGWASGFCGVLEEEGGDIFRGESGIGIECFSYGTVYSNPSNPSQFPIGYIRLPTSSNLSDTPQEDCGC